MKNKNHHILRVLEKKVTLILAVVFLLTMVSACGNSTQMSPSSNEMGYMDSAPQEKLNENDLYSGTSAGGTISAEYSKDVNQDRGEEAAVQPPSAPEELGRKIIKDGSAEIETIEFDKTLNNLYEMLIKNNGFVESQSLQGSRVNSSSLRYASIVIRVPSKVFDETMFNLPSLGTVFNQRTQGTDITDQYTDTESRVRNLKVQEDRILELITKAEKIEEIVSLEGRLSELRYQIESLENSLKNFDRLLDYSRITLSISEVVKVTDQKPVPKTISERLSQAFDIAWLNFVEGSQDLAVWVVYNIFTLIILFIIFVIVIMIISSGKNRKLRKQKKLERQLAKINTIADKANNQQANQYSNQPMNQGGNQPMNQGGNQPMNQPLNVQLNQSEDQVMNHSIATQKPIEELKPTDEK